MTGYVLNRFLELMKLPDGTPIVSTDLLEYLDKSGFFIKPASINHHGNKSGDLYKHSIAVMETLLKMKLKWSRPESPYIVGMFHDLCKVDDYVLDEHGIWEYNPHKVLQGHGDKSVMLLSQFINLTEEEMLCIRYHMGAYNKDDWEGFDLAIRNYENVLFTHTADMYASKVLNI